MLVAGSLSCMAPVRETRRYNLSQRLLVLQCFAAFGVELATNRAFQYLHLSACCTALAV